MKLKENTYYPLYPQGLIAKKFAEGQITHKLPKEMNK
jgi:hypothetical protein